MATPREAITAAVPLSKKDQREIQDIHRKLRTAEDSIGVVTTGR